MSIVAVTRKGEAYADALDLAIPGRLAGLYLVGSAALGDWQEKLSNVDVVAVAEHWDEAAIAASMKPQGLLSGGGPCRVAFVTFAHLAVRSSEPGPECREGGATIDPAEFATPLTWTIMAEDAVCLRGPEYFPVHHDEDDLRSWAADRLARRWAPWAAKAGRVPGQLWRRRALAESLLEVTRLHIAATRGQAVSKLRSGSMTLDDVPGHFQRVVTDAVGYRRGSRTSMYWGPVERKHHTLELIGELAQRARDQLPEG
ncbi:hypothetical protein K6U06_14240 [Acidiferrimicrobium sp. IK]|uniref:hypothetical protein n=1 Tax=Acidiferrimicrobium sp. IK TaxID=2871700 RepID=UPI0021CB9250|nr:hypothetical protein [Acidiferrimicrobium sp. IK]MCU4185528.1 hypothetical protein [Acidiferrimicrobium sp. IK]